MKPEFLLIDGHNLLFQMFFGMPSRIYGKDGSPIHGTLGFIGATLKIIRMTKPDYLVVLFDGEHENPRTELDAGYKANRAEDPRLSPEENPFSQLFDIYSALDYLHIRHAETSFAETDDVIASYAAKYRGKTHITICSYDSDFFQLIDENVSVLRYRGKSSVICDREYIKAKFGIEPEKYADFKSLTGDPADNVKGAEKIGKVTAAALINRFGTLENTLSSASLIEKPTVRESVMRSSDRLKTNYRLIKLPSDAEIPFEIESLSYEDRGAATKSVLSGIGLI